MRKRRSRKVTAPIFVAIVIGMAGIWYLIQKEKAFSEPQAAILAEESQLVLFPAYKRNKEALFFFIQDEKYLGVAYTEKRFLGWKAGPLTWGSPEIGKDYEALSGYYQLSGYQEQGDHLLYGLVSNGEERTIRVNDEEATLLNLEMLPTDTVQKLQLHGLFVWYVESEEPIEEGVIQLLSKDTEEVLDELEL